MKRFGPGFVYSRDEWSAFCMIFFWWPETSLALAKDKGLLKSAPARSE